MIEFEYTGCLINMAQKTKSYFFQYDLRRNACIDAIWQKLNGLILRLFDEDYALR